MKLIQPRRILAGLMMSMGLVVSAQADVYVKELAGAAGLGNGANLSLTLPVGVGTYFVGFQNISVAQNNTGANAQTFEALCVDPFHFSTTSFSPNYTPTSTDNVSGVFSSAVSADINTLFDKFYPSVKSNVGNSPDVKAAAFQLALWEIIVDNGSKNLGTGGVQASGINSTIYNQALTYLDLSNPPPLDPNNLTVYQVIRPNAGQDYIVVGNVGDNPLPVPEPEAYAMLLAGLGLMGVMARRKNR